MSGTIWGFKFYRCDVHCVYRRKVIEIDACEARIKIDGLLLILVIK